MANGERTKKISGNSWIVILFLCIFFYNGYAFLNTEGNSHPLVGSLFNMIIILAIFFYIFHKEKLINKKDDAINQTKQAYQTYLDKYFKILKK